MGDFNNSAQMGESQIYRQKRQFSGAFRHCAIALFLCYSITGFAEEQASGDNSPELPQLVVVDVTIKGISSDLQGTYELTSDQMLRYASRPGDDLVSPAIRQRHSSGQSRDISAEKGNYRRDLKTVTFTGNVVMEEFTPGHSAPMISRLENLTVRLDEWE